MPDPPRHVEQLSDAVTIAEAARLLGVSTRTVYRIIERKSLVPFYLPGSGRPRIPLDQIVAIRKRTDPEGLPAKDGSPAEHRARGPTRRAK